MRILITLFAISAPFTGICYAVDQVALAAIDGPCADGSGVCIATAKCTSGGGHFISNACPGTPDNIKCCTKPVCGTSGSCRWASQCTGTPLSGLCPGPTKFNCCYPPDPLGNLPELNSVQSKHTRVIISRVKRSGIAVNNLKRACQVAMVTARQESRILVLANSNVAQSYNYPYDGVGNDHDSVGIFQQRPSWGTVKDRMDPVGVQALVMASVIVWPTNGLNRRIARISFLML